MCCWSKLGDENNACIREAPHEAPHYRLLRPKKSLVYTGLYVEVAEFLQRGLQVHHLYKWLLRSWCREVLCRGIGRQDDGLIYYRWLRQGPAASPPWWLWFPTICQDAPIELGVTEPQPVPPDPVSLHSPLSIFHWADRRDGPQCPKGRNSSVPRHPPADWGINHQHSSQFPGHKEDPLQEFSILVVSIYLDLMLPCSSTLRYTIRYNAL